MKERERDQRPDAYRDIDFGGECDLHFFEPRETRAVVLEFIRQAKACGRGRIRLVHGKGISSKKRQVYDILADHPDVRSYGDDGANWGATIIMLKTGGE